MVVIECEQCIRNAQLKETDNWTKKADGIV